MLFGTRLTLSIKFAGCFLFNGFDPPDRFLTLLALFDKSDSLTDANACVFCWVWSCTTPGDNPPPWAGNCTRTEGTELWLFVWFGITAGGKLFGVQLKWEKDKQNLSYLKVLFFYSIDIQMETHLLLLARILALARILEGTGTQLEFECKFS